jgi:deoxyadenosine/deoxycytidine kinase
VPDRLVGLCAVVRIAFRHALAVPGRSLVIDANDDERFVVNASEAGLEKVHERKLQETQFEPVDLHVAMISSGRLHFRYIAIEGPIGAGKTALAARLGTRLEATVVLEETDNPFLSDFYADRPGAALQAQLFYLLSRHRQQTAVRQTDLFTQMTLCDYLFDKDKIFAYLNLDDNELFIYQRLFDLLARDVPAPDLVLYLQAPTDVLLRRVRSRRMDPESVALQPDDGYLRELNEAYHHFFFHYNSTPLLVVETSQFDSDASDEALDDLIKQVRAMGSGTRYYVPRTK